MIKYLNDSHIDQCIEISMLSSRHSGTSKNSNVDLLRCLNLERNCVVGYFVEDKIITWGSARFGLLHGEKTWSILGLYTSDFSDHFSFNRADFGLLISKFFEVAENDRYYNYIYSIATRLERFYDRKWSSNTFLPPTNRYIRKKLIEIPANELAPEQWQQRLLGGIKPDAMSILMRSLKEEFRK